MFDNCDMVVQLIGEKQVKSIQMEISEFKVAVIFRVCVPLKLSPPLTSIFFQEITSFYNASYCQVKQLRLAK